METGTSTVRFSEMLSSPQGQEVRIWLAEAAAGWVVRRGLEWGYHFFTGLDLPTGRSLDVPFRRVVLWAAVTAVALSVANVVVDQRVLRPRPPRKR